MNNEPPKFRLPRKPLRSHIPDDLGTGSTNEMHQNKDPERSSGSVQTENDPEPTLAPGLPAQAAVYAVRTTGIYCSLTCKARRSLPQNIEQYESSAAAVAAGYRACQRCQPHGAPDDVRQAQFVARACRLISEAEAMPSLHDLGAAVGVSPYHFHRVFKAVTGLTPKAYGDAERARRMREGLAADASSVTGAIYNAGYSSSSRFYDSASKRLGMTATAYRSGGKGAEIRFAVGQCSLGTLLVAATSAGIAAITLGDDPNALGHTLQDRFPAAALAGADRAFEALVARVVGAIETPALAAALPLDILGTAFQEQVWQALRRIPLGETATYTEIARQIKQPSAARAVANACGANPVAVAIPCHRVVRTDGALGGYRWGIERKQALLARETGGWPNVKTPS